MTPAELNGLFKGLAIAREQPLPDYNLLVDAIMDHSTSYNTKS